MASTEADVQLYKLNQFSTEPSDINLVWENLTVTIDKTTNKSALNNVNGYARAGRILGLMGPSSSGKTTLINLLSGRPLSQQLIFDSHKGNIYLNKQKINDRQILVDQCGFVDQPNELGAQIESISVREHLVFQAMLRLPPSMKDEDRYSRVNFLIKKLRLTSCENTLIQSLSGGEGRRITLASCLLTNPSVLLIDDLNSGLDSHLVLSLINHIRSLQKTTIVVLHQPSLRIMNYIDDLCLLGLNGRCIYMGPYEQALPVFYVKCPVDINPADFFLEQAAQARPTNPVIKSIECEQILQKQLNEIKKFNDKNEEIIYNPKTSYYSNFFKQVYWLMWRSISLRDLKRLSYLLAQSLIIALVYGLVDFNVERRLFTQTTVQDVAGLVFRILTIVTRVCSLMVIATYPIDHNLLERESKQLRLYSIGAYYISKCITDSPMFIIMIILFTVIVTVLTGMRHFIIQCGIFIVATLCSTALGYLVSSSMRSKEIRLIIWMPISQIYNTVSGYYVNTRSIPFILKWLQYTSVYYYSFSLSLITQWKDIDHISCKTTHWNATTNRCNNNGDDVLFSYNVDKYHEGVYWLELVALTVGFHLIAYIILLITLRRKK